MFITLLCHQAAMYRPLPQQLPALDGLRGVAALIVVVSHCANDGYLPAVLGHGFGQIGVAAFYLLSGFLMMHLAVQRRLDRASLRSFAIARVSRVLPLFYVMLAGSVPVLLTFGQSFYEIANPADLIGNALLLQGTGALWSIPVEVQFYLVFPLLWWAHDRGRFAIAALSALVGCAALAWLRPAPAEADLLPYWLHVFVIGALLRWAIDDGRRNLLDPDRARATARWGGWAVLAALPLLPPEIRVQLGWSDFPNRYDPVAILVVPVALWLACTAVGPLLWLASRPLRWYGTISYGLYLIHSPVLSIWKRFAVGAALGPLLQFASVLAVSTLGAWAAYRWVERPARHYLRARYASPSIAAQP